MIPVLIGIAALLIVGGFGFPLGLSLMLIGYLGFGVMHPKGLDAASTVAGQQILELALNFQFAVLPLFLLMGVFVNRSGISDDLYETANRWFGHMKGGLAISTVAACGGFAAISGSSVATAATMARVAVPSMRKYKYNDAFSAGTVAAGGTMGILIPPSGALIIYGLIAEVDIAKLFVAGIVPGLITIAAYMVVIRLVCMVKPDWGPPAERFSWRERLTTVYKVWGIVFLFFLIMGGIFFGVFTPSEAGGIGAAGALVFAIARGRMNWRVFFDSLLEAGKTTAIVFTVAFGALMLNQFVNIAGAPEDVLGFIRGLNISPWMVVVMVLLCYVVLGMFIDGIAMIFLTVPIFVPLIEGLGLPIDPGLVLIWWGIVLVMVVEISLITPPIGMNVFVISSMLPDVSLKQVFQGIVPFFVADIGRLALVVIFPATALWLTRFMG